MAENSKPGLFDKAEKILRRKKTKVLQSLGKQGRTTDEILVEDCQRLEKQQEVANKFQKDLRTYINCARALSVASKTFYSTVSEAYEPEWENHAQITEILTNMDMLWQDYLQKLHEQVQEPLAKYLATIPQIKSRVAKRGRKLIDYDNAKHGIEHLQNAKKKDEAKIAKAQEDLEQAKKIYEDLNNELHQELPEFYNSRVRFYGNLFQSLFSAENVFQTESGKVWASAPDCNFDDGTDVIILSSNKLATDHEHCTYTPRKSVRNTLVIGSPMHLARSDENLTNGHPENGQTESASSSSPSSPTSPVMANASVNLTNEHNDADTSKESIDDSAYESTAFQEQSKEETKAEEPKVEASLTTNTIKDVVEEKTSEVVKAETDVTEKVEENVDVVEEVKEIVSEIKQEEEKKPEPEEVNGDLDTSTEQEVTNDAPPPVPASPPPEEEKKGKDNDDDDDDGDDDDNSEQTEGIADNDLYQVPPPAKPVDDDLPKKYLHTDDNTCDSDDEKPDKFLFKVVATHAYKGEDEDELSFDAQEVIYVIQYDDPEEQDPGWLMGVRKINRQVGVFPENFTKKV